MSDTSTRLQKCFTDLFPRLSRAEIEKASTENVREWDSVAMVSLVSLIEEEFGITVEFEDMETLTSFEQIVAHLNFKKPA